MEVDTRRTDAAFRRDAVFDTYLAAHREMTRRGSEDAANGMISKVVRSPYGGFVIRSWPVEMLAEPELRSVLVDRTSSYANR